jgi:hypothetical protein
MFFREKERRKNEESRTESLDLEEDDGPSFSFSLQGLACGNEIGDVEMGGNKYCQNPVKGTISTSQ